MLIYPPFSYFQGHSSIAVVTNLENLEGINMILKNFLKESQNIPSRPQGFYAHIRSYLHLDFGIWILVLLLEY